MPLDGKTGKKRENEKENHYIRYVRTIITLKIPAMCVVHSPSHQGKKEKVVHSGDLRQ